MREAAVSEAEIQHLERQVHRLERNELDAELFKKLRLQYGIYSMRRSASGYMVRVRIRLGILSADQVETLAQICERFVPSRSCHLTTRQDVQLYGIERDHLPAFLRQLAGVGLTTREASGNVVRNVTCCPWAGVSPDEPFDITPYAQAVGEYLLRNPLTQLLPRKVKIAFEGCATDHARIPIHDIGIVAAPHNGQAGFRIYAGGGLGPLPRAAQLLEPWTSRELLMPTVEAILRVFDRYGERKNRARARLKFFVEALGWEEFRTRVLEERSGVWATQSGQALRALESHEEPQPVPKPVEPVPVSDAQGLARWTTTNVFQQKQPGFSTVLVRVPLGDLTAMQLRGIAHLVRRYATGVRVTNTQDLLLRFVAQHAVGSVYDALKRLGLAEAGADRMVDVTRCPGADTCLSAITRPRGLAEMLERLMHDGLSAWADEPLSIKISGCPNSCGHHHIADIGFFGMAVKVSSRYVPCYQMLLGGGTHEGAAQFGKKLARIPACRAPEAVTRVLQLYHEQRRSNERFGETVTRIGLAPFQQALEDLATLPRDIADPQLVVDLGTTRPFELEAGKGECAA